MLSISVIFRKNNVGKPGNLDMVFLHGLNLIIFCTDRAREKS
jgi:hypothetical protein